MRRFKVSEIWSVTIQLGDPQGRRIATETLNFGSRDAAHHALTKLTSQGMFLAKQLYTLENEIGEQISFVGERYISHSLLNVTPIDLEF
jgi:hypothetical protein